MKVPLAVNGLSGCLVVLEVAHHDVSASENDLSTALLVRVVNLQVSSSQSEADRSKVEFLIVLHRSIFLKLNQKLNFHLFPSYI